MGRRRVLTALLALVLALAGTTLLLRYVHGADERALAGTATTEVLVVKKSVSRGTPVEELAASLDLRTLPAMAVAPGALSSLGEAGGRVAAVDLQPGEQLLSTRLVDPATLTTSGEVVVPPGFQEVSVSLEPQRMLGGELHPGDLVGVVVSLAKDDNLPAVTEFVLQKVLVVRVGQSSSSPAAGSQTGAGGASSSSTTGGGATGGTAAMPVTLAVNGAAAQKIVFGAENGRLWLTRQSATTPTATPSPLTRRGAAAAAARTAAAPTVAPLPVPAPAPTVTVTVTPAPAPAPVPTPTPSASASTKKE